ncbi:uncharacterized protein LOC134838106 [Culicoides brevitarsis]|uniref:uncharacterized protein LOC134838106 n=1 Tax=Culicoides brevitarsis TaxID=469753 RepID=UPI00307C2E44
MYYLEFLSIFLLLTPLINSETVDYPTETTPNDSDPRTQATGEGSYYEYIVRNVIRNSFYYPRIQSQNGVTPLEQMVYYYHLQMTHIDLMWTRNWERTHRHGYPSVFQLPSRAVRYHYNHDVPYQFPDGIERTLDSHRLNCTECIRQFHCNVENLHNHRSNRYMPNPEQKYERRTTIPEIEIELESQQRSWLPQMVSTNKAMNTTQLAEERSFVCAGPSHGFTTTTTEDSLEHQLKKVRYDFVRDELRRRRRTHA